MTRCPNDGTALGVSIRQSAVGLGRTGLDAFGEESTGVAPEPQEQELAAGMQVGEYTISGKLGEGGMGTVYGGVHPIIGKKVAVKVLNRGLSEDAQMVQRFVQEARAVNQIGHRNIVDIFAFGQLPSGRHYFVMELLAGRSLKQRLEQPPLPYDEAVSLLAEVCDALAAAHAEGIVHRDLKPDNIFIVESKSGARVVKVLDFGIAKLLRSDEEQVGQSTRTGVPIGTPLYMSPEQCLGRGVDHRTDVYSLGVIMYELFTGQVPFPGPSYIETVNGHLSQLPRSPRELVSIPAAVEQLILACLEKDADARPQSMAEVQQRLRELAPQVTAIGDIPRASHTARGPSAAPIAGVRPGPAGRARHVASYGAVAALAGVLAVGAVMTLRRKADPAAAARAGRSAAAPAQEDLQLQILSEPPGAVVTIDGARQDLRTPSVFRITQRRPRVLLTRDGFQPHEEQVELTADEKAKALVVQLKAIEAAAGSVAARVAAKHASWTLDGNPVGAGPELSLPRIPAGKHVLRVEAKGFAPRQEELTLQPGQRATLEWTLSAVGTRAEVRSSRPSKVREATSPRGGLTDDENATSGWPPR